MKPHYRLRQDGSVILLHDGFVNAVSQLGGPRDKSAFGRYQSNTLHSADLLAMYDSSWLAKKVVDTPANDAVSKWRGWNAEDDQISAIEAEEKRLGIVLKAREAMQSARLFGFCAIYISTGDSDVSEPIRLDRIRRGGIRHLTVMGHDILTPSGVDRDPDSPNFGEPEFYTMQAERGDMRIHPSRLIRLYGDKPPVGDSGGSINMSPKAVGGAAYYRHFSSHGQSVLLPSWSAIRNYDSLVANIATLIYEAQIDVLYVPDLMQKMSEDPDRVMTYLRSVATMKGNLGQLVLDNGPGNQLDGESRGMKFDRKSITFGGLHDLWDRSMIDVSGAAGIPATYLFGMSPAGQNATGESDKRNYGKMLSTMQQTEIEPALAGFDEVLIRSALGSRPADIWYNWRPTFEKSEQEISEIGKITADIIKILSETGLYDPAALEQAATNALTEAGVMPGLESAAIDFPTDFMPDE